LEQACPLHSRISAHGNIVNHPWTFALPFNAEKSGFTKAFIGDMALEQIDNAE
jgi:aminomethyltransferase